MVYVRKSLRVFLRRVTFYGLIRFTGITGGVQDPGVEPRGYNGEVLWRPTATKKRLFLRFYKVEVLGYMRNSVGQQHEGSPSMVVIYSRSSLTWRNLGKRFVVQTLRQGRRPMAGFLSATPQFYNVDVLCGGSFYDL